MIPQPFDYSPQYPLARQLTETAAQEEIPALVQFAFFQPYLAALLRACADADLPLIVLKGAALAETVYPRPSLRLFGDLDVLVKSADIFRARELLEGLGYVPEARQWEELAAGRYCQTNFFQHPERGAVVVELHTELINNPLLFGYVRFDEVGVWERSCAAHLAGTDARVLGPEDQLLHLCLHLASHYLAAPRSLRDIDRVCRHEHIDWELLTALARRVRATMSCFAGLFAVSRLLGTSVPTSTLDALAPRFGRRLLERLAAARATDISQSRTESLRFPLLLFLLETPAARGNALKRLCFPTSRWLSAHYYFNHFQQEEPPAVSRRDYYVLLWVHWGSLLRRLMRRALP